MKDITELAAIMLRISELLRVGGYEELASLIDGYREQLSQDTSDALARIATLYGGMGSINDIILCRQRQPLFKENHELDSLLSRLHEGCTAT